VKVKSTAVVVISTCNESDIIGGLVDDLFTRIFPLITSWRFKVLIVDRDSADGTADVIRGKQNHNADLDLIHAMRDEGISAVREKGISYAVTALHADVVIEYEGDCHIPSETIPAMLGKVEEGADCVLASRRMNRGFDFRGSSPMKQLFSRARRFLARAVLFFPTRAFFRIPDPASGLRLSRANYLAGAVKDLRHLRDPVYKVETLYRMMRMGAAVETISFDCHPREMEERRSAYRVPRGIVKNAFALRLRDPVTKRFLKFCTVGFIGFVINESGLEIFRNTPVSLVIAEYFARFERLSWFSLLSSRSAWSAGLATEIAIISNYMLNNFWTFSESKITSPLRFFFKLLQFNLTSFGAVVIQFVVIGTATRFLGDTPTVRVVFLVLSIAFLVIPYNWTMYNKVIWRKRKKSKA
jgi:dolichol-phosphate mannosyltransferase